MAHRSSSIIVNSNGAFFNLSDEGVLEVVHFEDNDGRIGLSKNLASSSVSAATSASKASDHCLGLVGQDVHGNRVFAPILRAKV